jgi:hypothetical protein
MPSDRVLSGTRNVFYTAGFILVLFQIGSRSFVLTKGWFDVALFPGLALALAFALLILKSELAANSRKLVLPWLKKLPSDHARIVMYPFLAFMAVAQTSLFGVPYVYAEIKRNVVEINTEAEISMCNQKGGSYPCVTFEGLVGSPPASYFPDLPIGLSKFSVRVSGIGSTLGFYVKDVQLR